MNIRDTQVLHSALFCNRTKLAPNGVTMLGGSLIIERLVKVLSRTIQRVLPLCSSDVIDIKLIFILLTGEFI